MKLSQFKFKLPEDRIAQYPAEHRDESRLMVVHKKSDEIEHVLFKDILNFFDEKDVFVFNDTRVFPARMYGNKEKTGAQIEVFLLRELREENQLWDVQVDPARKIRIGNKLYFGEDTICGFNSGNTLHMLIYEQSIYCSCSGLYNCICTLKLNISIKSFGS